MAAGGLVGAGLGALATVNPAATVTLAAGLSFGNLLGSTLRQSSGSSGLNPCDGLIASQSAQSAASSAGGSGGSGPTLAGGGGVGVLALPVAGTAAGRLAAIPGAAWTTGLEIALRLNFLYSSSSGDDDDGGNRIDENPDRLRHMFRDAEGHFTADTPENRQLIERVANNPTNRLGTDGFGNSWFAETQMNGNQIWVKVRGNRIVEAGINTTPRTFNSATGLTAPPRR